MLRQPEKARVKFISATVAVLIFLAWPAQGASLSKSYSYFSIGGNTMDEIQKELDRRGPKLNSTGRRHPGATLMEFNTRIKYGERGDRCEIIEADVRVKAKVILPRWRARRRSDSDTQLIWDTLSADIKRHEESHVVIAKNHARELEDTLMKTYPQRNCELAAAKAKEITHRVLARHDAAQAKFDRIEGINFERRILRLLNYRIERAASGR
jgi:predicted secreted Zn-dependent protease